MDTDNINYVIMKMHCFAAYDDMTENLEICEIDHTIWEKNIVLEYIMSQYDISPIRFNFNAAIIRYLTFAYDKNEPTKLGIAVQSYYDKMHNRSLGKEIAFKRLSENPIVLDKEFFESRQIIQKKLPKKLGAKFLYELLLDYDIYKIFKKYMTDEYSRLTLEIIPPKWY